MMYVMGAEQPESWIPIPRFIQRYSEVCLVLFSSVLNIEFQMSYFGSILCQVLRHRNRLAYLGKTGI